MAKSWPAKDPQATLDYVYRIPLDAGDSIASFTLTRLSGTATLDASGDLAAAPDTTAAGYGQDVTDIWISGGVDGETNVFRIAWTTALTRADDDIITLSVAAHELEDLALTGYVKPLPGHLALRYPAFADVPVATIRFWLADAERAVTQAWGEGDYAAGLMSLAAHNMALAGLGADAAALATLPAGVSRFKSGTLDVTLTDAAANARMSGGISSTRYGQEYVGLLARNRGGPLVSPTGAAPDGAYPLVWP